MKEYPMHSSEVAIVHRAMQWFDRQWPFDPESMSDTPPTVWPDIDGEVLVPDRVEVRHIDGWRIGWIAVEDDQTVFVRDYAEDPR